MDWMRLVKIVMLVTGLSLVGWLTSLFAASENAQMLRSQERFIQALEARKWSKVDAMICPDYADEWRQDAALVKHNLREVFKGFIFLRIEARTVSSDDAKGLAWVKQTVMIEGTGGGLSNTVISESRRIKEPWIFHWHKRGRWPWSWELVQVHNSQATISL